MTDRKREREKEREREREREREKERRARECTCACTCTCVCNCVFVCSCVPACIQCIRVHVYVTGEREGGKESLLGSLEADCWPDRSLRPTVPASGRRLTESWNLRRKRRDAVSLGQHRREQSTLDHQPTDPH